MNKKGFTLIELIAVVVIMGIIAVIATPSITNMVSNGKKNDFVSDASEIMTKATYMYKQEKYSNFFMGGKITLSQIVGAENYNDCGMMSDCQYNRDSSYVEFTTVGNERKARVYLLACEKKDNVFTNNCFHIDAYKDNLTVDSVKEGK